MAATTLCEAKERGTCMGLQPPLTLTHRVPNGQHRLHNDIYKYIFY